MVYTFWEGPMPEYIKLCMDTWKVDYKVLNYDNLGEYIALPMDRVKGLTLQLLADCVRVHLLRDYGGYWLDADTIMLSPELPEENIVGLVKERTNTIGFLHTEPHTEMYEKWAAYQDRVLKTYDKKGIKWDMVGNSFTDDYIKNNKDISIYPSNNLWPEVYMIKEDIPREQKYKKFYFEKNYNLKDIKQDKLLMLHNSWTPNWYKELSREDVLKQNCTLSNILRELNESSNLRNS